MFSKAMATIANYWERWVLFNITGKYPIDILVAIYTLCIIETIIRILFWFIG